MKKKYSGRENYRRRGSVYEQLAGRYLQSLGYQILEYNFRCRMGEIDIIAKDGDCFVFCEVKYRADITKGFPSEAVNYRKQRVISKCALYYVTVKEQTNAPCRFDVIAILGGTDHEKPKVQHIQNAFAYIG